MLFLPAGFEKAFELENLDGRAVAGVIGPAGSGKTLVVDIQRGKTALNGDAWERLRRPA